MGSFRAVAQFISYEIIFSIVFLPIALITESINFINIVKYQINHGWFVFYLTPFVVIFIIIALAETNRTPFDLPEAEAELVSGFNVEYSSLLFASFFLAEYSSMGLISAIFVICFLGGWSTLKLPFFINENSVNNLSIENYINLNFFSISEIIIFSTKIIICCFIFILIRASLPRKRFDQLIHLCWKILFPFTFSLTMLCISLYTSFTYFICGYNNYYGVIRHFSRTLRVSFPKNSSIAKASPEKRKEFAQFLLDNFEINESFTVEYPSLLYIGLFKKNINATARLFYF